MPTVSASGNLMVSDHLGRADVLHQHTTISPIVSSVISLLTSPTSQGPTSIYHPNHMAELMMAPNDYGHSQSAPMPQSDQVTAIQAPLFDGGLEHSSALIHALLASFSVILVSELGDKTFIITAIMAMKNSRSLVFMSSAFALFLMTVLSVGMGVAVTVIPELYTHYASIVLFLCFGLKMLKEAYDMDAENVSGESEFDEVKRSLEEEEIEREKDQVAGRQSQNKQTTSSNNIKYIIKPLALEPKQSEQENKLTDINENDANDPMVDTQEGDTDQQVVPSSGHVDDANKNKPDSSCWNKFVETIYVAPIVIKVFTMIMVAEWGDRSQISTVILAAREDSVGVFVGSLSGHVLCTGLAVIGGRVVAEIISIRTLTFIGGIIFLFFATFELVIGSDNARG